MHCTTLTFSREQLLYDIANYAYIEAHRLDIDDSGGVKAHLLSDIEADGNIDRIDRTLALAYSEVLQMLGPAAAEHCLPTEVADGLWVPPTYEIRLTRRCHEGATAQLLSRLIHEYMVATALSDWLSITHPEYSATWREKADIAMRAISANLSGMRRCWRRGTGPF